MSVNDAEEASRRYLGDEKGVLRMFRDSKNSPTIDFDKFWQLFWVFVSQNSLFLQFFWIFPYFEFSGNQILEISEISEFLVFKFYSILQYFNFSVFNFLGFNPQNL